MNRVARSTILAVIALLIPLLASSSPVDAAQLMKFEAVEGALVDGPEVFKNQDVAQSFNASTNYHLLRVEVNVHDLSDDTMPFDPLDLSVQSDAGGAPSGTVLAAASADGVLGYNWIPFDLIPGLDLVMGQTYWIVLEDNNLMNQPDGYKWARRSGDPYPPGRYSLRTGGGGWVTAPVDDLLFRNWGIQGPAIAAAISEDSSTAGPGDPLVYTVFFNNTGTEIAGTVWTNVTLGTNLTYESDTSAPNGGVAVGPMSWSFADVAVGTHRFDIGVRIGLTAFDGLVLTTQLSVEYVDSASVFQERTEAEASVLIRAPSVSITKDVSPRFLSPGENLTYSITIVNAGSRPSPWVWVNDTLPTEVNFLGHTANLLPSFDSDSWDGSALRIVFADLDRGSWAFSILASAKPGLSNGTTFTNTVFLDFADSRGSVVPPTVSSSATARIHGASIQVVKTADVATTGAGQDVRYRIRYDNRGDAVASAVWINDTLPSAILYVSDTGGGVLAGNILRFAFTNVAVGPHSLTIVVNVLPGTPDGQVVRNTANLDIADAGGMMLASSSSVADVTVVAPRVTIAIAGPALADPGDLWEAAIEVRNDGNASAFRVWLNRTWSTGLGWVSDDASLYGGVGSANGWTFSNVQAAFVFHLSLRLAAGLANGTALAVRISADYVDSWGSLSSSPNATAAMTVTTPDFLITSSLTRSAIAIGESSALLVSWANVGAGVAAHVWVNVTVPEGIDVVSASLSWVATTGFRYTWHLTNVPSGGNELSVVLRAESPVVGNGAVSSELTFTDANENLIGVRQTGTTISTPGGGLTPQTWSLVLLVAIVALLASFIAYRVYGFGRGERAQIHQLFLLHKSGLLIKHYSRTLRGDLDSDILAAMIVAVQNFVRETFRFRKGDLEEMKYGNHKILLVHGQTVILAALVSGHYMERMKTVLRVALQRLEQDYGVPLREWDGMISDFEGVDQIMDQTLQGRPPYRNGTPHRNGTARPPSPGS